MSEEKEKLPEGMVELDPVLLNSLLDVYVKEFSKDLDKEIQGIKKDWEMIKYVLTR